MKAFLALLSLTLLLPVTALAKDRSKAKPEPVAANVELWLPPDFQSGKGPWPLILFSHGFGGCAKQSTFLTAYLAEQGYIVVAPDHKDARTCKSVRAYEMQKDMLDRVPEKPFSQPQQWNEGTYVSRRDDMKAALASILSDPLFKGYVDEDRMGLMGHSLGAYTALGMAGAWQSWKDQRFKAVMVLAPYTSPYVMEKTLGDIDIPVMYMSGGRDYDNTETLKRSGNGAYAQTNAPKHFMELSSGGESSFTERDPRYHDVISKQTLAFFDLYLMGKDATIHSVRDKSFGEYKEDVKIGRE
jgi:predicted dienelactone hydrolase